MTSSLLVLAGPTASGKTDAAIAVSKRVSSEIISFDSMQAYRHLEVVTQSPSSAEIKKYRIRLTAFLEPELEYSAAQFREEAAPLIQRIHKEKKLPVLVGGTGLYLRALLDGLFEASDGGGWHDESLRVRLAEEAQKDGSKDFLHKKLAAVDPVSAAKIHPNDTRRLLRALEVYFLSGQPISAHHPKRQGIRNDLDCRIFLLDREREDLYERIDRRVDRMAQEGLVEEVKKALKRDLSRTAAGALGLKEIRSFLEGQRTLEEALELLKKNTRNYAKRQLTWFRHEKGVERFPVHREDSAEKIASNILERLEKK